MLFVIELYYYKKADVTGCDFASIETTLNEFLCHLNVITKAKKNKLVKLSPDRSNEKAPCDLRSS